MATHSSILAWRIPMDRGTWPATVHGLQRVGINLVTEHQKIVMLPGSASGKESAYQCRRCKRREFNPWVGKVPWKRAWQPTPVFLSEESCGWRRLAGYSP